MRSSLCTASAAPPSPVAPVANVEREAKSVVATELPINVRRFMRRIVLLQPQKGIAAVNQLPMNAAGSNGRCNTIWYKAVFKGGVYETRETVWAFGGAETRRVASLEGRADAA